MKITDNRKKNLVNLKDLDKGTLFYMDNELYIKIPRIENELTRYNCVMLPFGNICYISHNTTVELVNNCELILQD